MNQKATILLCGLTFAAGLLLVHPDAYGQAGALDPTHYWSYKLLDPRIIPSSIQTSDQFSARRRFPFRSTRSNGW